jgi:hypothetical protein
MSLLRITDYAYPGGYSDGASAQDLGRRYAQELEDGKILCFDKPPFDLPDDDRQFLLAQKQSAFKGHKNISYRPLADSMRGAEGGDPKSLERLHGILRHYSQQVTQFLGSFLTPYKDKWKMDFASFRPLQEKGRQLSLHKRNDLLHVDAFPSRPTNGGRILRIFTNINPEHARIWEITDRFDVIAKRYANDVGLPRIAQGSKSTTRAILKGMAPVLKAVGVKGADRSAYDQFMLRFHDWLKENTDYQTNYPKERVEFPPGSVWMVYTDTVPHAALAGQFALEQTYIIPLDAMVRPASAPIRVLEEMCGTALSN